MKIQLNSWPIRFLTKICDLIILNVIFIAACMTIVFSGAAITALYTVTLRMTQAKEYAPLRGFLRSLRDNFVPSVPATVLLFIDVMLFAFLYTALYAEILIISPTLFVLLSIVAVLTTAILGYLFPLLAQFENTFPRHLGNAAKLALACLPVTFLLTIVDLLPLLLTMFLPDLFGAFAAFWMLIGFAAGAYLNSFYLNRVFKRKNHAEIREEG